MAYPNQKTKMERPVLVTADQSVRALNKKSSNCCRPVDSPVGESCSRATTTAHDNFWTVLLCQPPSMAACMVYQERCSQSTNFTLYKHSSCPTCLDATPERTPGSNRVLVGCPHQPTTPALQVARVWHKFVPCKALGSICHTPHNTARRWRARTRTRGSLPMYIHLTTDGASPCCVIPLHRRRLLLEAYTEARTPTLQNRAIPTHNWQTEAQDSKERGSDVRVRC